METAYDQRSFNMTYPELVVFATNIANNLTRDRIDLAVFGITAEKITAFEAQIDHFSMLPPDEVYVGEQMIATQHKDEVAEQVRENIRYLIARMEAKWGTNSGQIKTLNAS